MAFLNVEKREKKIPFQNRPTSSVCSSIFHMKGPNNVSMDGSHSQALSWCHLLYLFANVPMCKVH